MTASFLRDESEFARDFTTPQGAILKLEDAYRNKDIDAAVAAKHFRLEAELMLSRLPLPHLLADDKVVAQTATTLELAFRSQLEHGFPDMTGTRSSFSEATLYTGVNGGLVVTEVVRYPDGRTSRQEMIVAETENGWRVLIPMK